MPKIAALTIAVAVLGAGAAAHADIFNVYVQGHGGVSGNDTSPGPTLGAEVGAKVLFVNGYLGIDDFVSHGTVTRAILGLGSDIELIGWRVSGRAGAGLLFENNGVFGMTAPVVDRRGFVARAGVALDRQVATALYLGIALDGEYFAIKPTDDAALDTSVHTGADVLASLHLKFELGI